MCLPGSHFRWRQTRRGTGPLGLLASEGKQGPERVRALFQTEKCAATG